MHRHTHWQAHGAVLCFEVRLQEGTQESSTLKHAAMPQACLCSHSLSHRSCWAAFPSGKVGDCLLHVALGGIPVALGGGCRYSPASSCLSNPAWELTWYTALSAGVSHYRFQSNKGEWKNFHTGPSRFMIMWWMFFVGSAEWCCSPEKTS